MPLECRMYAFVRYGCKKDVCKTIKIYHDVNINNTSPYKVNFHEKISYNSRIVVFFFAQIVQGHHPTGISECPFKWIESIAQKWTTSKCHQHKKRTYVSCPSKTREYQEVLFILCNLSHQQIRGREIRNYHIFWHEKIEISSVQDLIEKCFFKKHFND